MKGICKRPRASCYYFGKVLFTIILFLYNLCSDPLSKKYHSNILVSFTFLSIGYDFRLAVIRNTNLFGAYIPIEYKFQYCTYNISYLYIGCPLFIVCFPGPFSRKALFFCMQLFPLRGSVRHNESL